MFSAVHNYIIIHYMFFKSNITWITVLWSTLDTEEVMEMYKCTWKCTNVWFHLYKPGYACSHTIMKMLFFENLTTPTMWCQKRGMTESNRPNLKKVKRWMLKFLHVMVVFLLIKFFFHVLNKFPKHNLHEVRLNVNQKGWPEFQWKV